jgi:hypothetical protein
MLTLSVAILTCLFNAVADNANAAPATSHCSQLRRSVNARSSSSPDMCIGVEILQNGAQVIDENCTSFNPTSSPPFHNQWEIVPGNNQVVRLSGLPEGSGNLCLDSGDSMGWYPAAKVWTCYPGMPGQQ